MKTSRIIDLAILALLTLFFVGLLAFDYASFGLKGPLIALPYALKGFFKSLIWPLVALFILDLYVKYIETKNPGKFVRKYWLDILMLLLIPILATMKLLKIVPNLAKKMKTAKTGAKIALKTKKVRKD